MRVYFDTSFLASLFSPDVNSADAARTMRARGDERLLTVIGEFELINALELRVFRKEITAGQARKSAEKFRETIRSGIFRLAAMPASVFDRAAAISQRTTATLGTRAIDVVHVASALELGADALYSFDEKQRKLARAMRMKVN